MTARWINELMQDYTCNDITISLRSVTHLPLSQLRAISFITTHRVMQAPCTISRVNSNMHTLSLYHTLAVCTDKLAVMKRWYSACKYSHIWKRTHTTMLLACGDLATIRHLHSASLVYDVAEGSNGIRISPMDWRSSSTFLHGSALELGEANTNNRTKALY